jgi:DNA-binding GntR family transcriptional regulator
LPVGRTIHEQLRTAIVALELPPGRALSEQEIAARLGVSRTPVREALGRLVEDGLVVVVPQVGSFVRRIDLDEVHEAQFVREALETAALRVAVGRSTAAAVVRMRQRIDEQRQAATDGDLEAFFLADEALHAEVFALAGHSGAWRIMRSARFQMDRLRRLSLPQRGTLDALVEEHERLVDGIAAGDRPGAEATLRSHARRVLAYAPALARAHPDFFEVPAPGRVEAMER